MRSIWSKLLISIVIIVLIFNFIAVPQSKAVIIDGGILLKPITTFLGIVFMQMSVYTTIFVAVISDGLAWRTVEIEDPVAILQSWLGIEDTDGEETGNDTSNEETTEDAEEETTEEEETEEEENQAGTITVQSVGLLSMMDFFTGQLQISNVNIFANMPGSGNSGNSIIDSIKEATAGWYYSLRNIAGVGLLCVLIYIAIRILLSTIAEEKAHYKDLLTDWIKATCLVIFIHVLMIIILNVSDAIVDILKQISPDFAQSPIGWVAVKLFLDFNATQLVYVTMFGMLVYYTIVFTISYTKRFLYTMILIIIAPIVALLYAFGKEGKNIFQKWLKEFIVNAFLQPYHMLIYTVLFGFVMTMVSQAGFNIFIALYALVVLHFIKDAEKYYRALFGMGQGIAGIGQADTGVKTVETVKKKVTETAQQLGKVAISAAALAIPAAGAFAGAANAAQAAQAANATDAAQNLGDIAGGFNGGNPPPDGNLPALPGGPRSPIGPGGGDDVDPGGTGTNPTPPTRDEYYLPPHDGDGGNGGNNGDGGNDGDDGYGEDLTIINDPEIEHYDGNYPIIDSARNGGMNGGINGGQNIGVNTIVAQNLAAQNSLTQNAMAQNMAAQNLDAPNISGVGEVEVEEEKNEPKDEHTLRLERHERIKREAMDNIIGAPAATFIRTFNDTYPDRIEERKNAGQNTLKATVGALQDAAILGADAAVNGPVTEEHAPERDGVEGNGDTTVQEGDNYNKSNATLNVSNKRGDTAINASSSVNANSNVNTNSNIDAHQETTEVKPAEVQHIEASNLSTSDIERVISEKFGSMKGVEFTPEAVKQMATMVGKNLEQQGVSMDTRALETLVNKAIGNNTSAGSSTVTINNINQSTTSNNSTTNNTVNTTNNTVNTTNSTVNNATINGATGHGVGAQTHSSNQGRRMPSSGSDPVTGIDSPGGIDKPRRRGRRKNS